CQLTRRPPCAAGPRWLRPSSDSPWRWDVWGRSEEHTSELQSLTNLVCRLLLEKKKRKFSKLALILKNSQHFSWKSWGASNRAPLTPEPTPLPASIYGATDMSPRHTNVPPPICTATVSLSMAAYVRPPALCSTPSRPGPISDYPRPHSPSQKRIARLLHPLFTLYRRSPCFFFF